MFLHRCGEVFVRFASQAHRDGRIEHALDTPTVRQDRHVDACMGHRLQAVVADIGERRQDLLDERLGDHGNHAAPAIYVHRVIHHEMFFERDSTHDTLLSDASAAPARMRENGGAIVSLTQHARLSRRGRLSV
jgi:hypothetical protein